MALERLLCSRICHPGLNASDLCNLAFHDCYTVCHMILTKLSQIFKPISLRLASHLNHLSPKSRLLRWQPACRQSTKRDLRHTYSRLFLLMQ